MKKAFLIFFDFIYVFIVGVFGLTFLYQLSVDGLSLINVIAVLAYYLFFGIVFGLINFEHWRWSVLLCWGAGFVFVASILDSLIDGYSWLISIAIILTLPMVLIGAYFGSRVRKRAKLPFQQEVKPTPPPSIFS